MPNTTIKRQRVADGIENITLNDIKVEYDIEKILLEGYKGAERDLACFLIKKHYEKRIAGFKSKITDRNIQDRVLIESKWFTLDLLTTNLPALIDRTHLYMLIEADQTGWYRKMEYKDLEELIYSMIEDVDQSGSEAYDWRFIVEKLVPAARAFGIKPEMLGNATHQIRKLRQAIPTARLILKRHEAGDLTDAKARKDLKWVVEQLADPKITSFQMKPELDKYRGVVPDSEVEIKGYVYLTGDDTSLMLIEVKSKLEMSIIEQRLRKRVNFQTADYKEFAQMALELLNIKEDELLK